MRGSQFCTFEIAETANESQPACIIGRRLFAESLTLRTRLRGAFQPLSTNDDESDANDSISAGFDETTNEVADTGDGLT